MEMRIPQVTDRMKQAPTQALRAVFGGIGQLLLIVDRMKSREQDPAESAPAQSKQSKEPAKKPAPVTKASYDTRWRSLDKTGNVRLLGAEDLADGEADSSETASGGYSPQAAADIAPGPVAEPEPRPAETTEPQAAVESQAAAPESQPAEPVRPQSAEPVAATAVAVSTLAAPWPNYDDLSFASLRARMRGLDQPQLRALAEYEQAHANRENVVTMFERRIAKLELGEG